MVRRSFIFFVLLAATVADGAAYARAKKSYKAETALVLRTAKEDDSVEIEGITRLRHSGVYQVRVTDRIKHTCEYRFYGIKRKHSKMWAKRIIRYKHCKS